LDGRAKDAVITDTDWANVKNHTVEIEVYMAAELNVEPIIAIKRGLDLNSVASLAEELHKDLPANGVSWFSRIERTAESASPFSCLEKLGIVWVIEFTSDHSFPFRLHGPAPSKS